MKLRLLILLCFFQQIVFSQPVITSFAPASGPVGTSVIITGTGFSSTAANNIVYFGAVRGVVTAATATSVTVTVPAGTTYKPISVMVAGLTGFSRKPFTVTFGNGGPITSASFATRSDMAANTSGTISINIKDLDNDGKPDITSGNVSVYKNNSTPGNPAISAPTNLTGNSLYYYTAVEDLDGDGRADILAPVYSSILTEVRIFKNVSSGSSLAFNPPLIVPTNGGFGIVTADFDNDGKIDFATTNSTGNGRLSVHRNTSSIGNIAFAPRIDLGSSESPRAITVAFLNNDDKPDLIITHIGPSNILRVLINSSTPGNISFVVQNPIPVGAIFGLGVGDFDGDDKTDIAVATSNSASMGLLSIFRNTSTGSAITLAPRVDYNTGLNTLPRAVAVGDINGDGKPDIAISKRNTNAISVFENNSTSGNISFQPNVDFMAPESVEYALEINDFDVDGKPDIVIGSYSPNQVISVFRNIVGAPPSPPLTLTAFNATLRNNDVYLTWTAQYGQNLRNFVVERSVDGVFFNTVGTVAAVSNSNAIQQYQYTDVNAVSLETENVYYRLRPVNLNGTSTYSNAVVLNTGNISFEIVNVTPTLFTDKFTLNINAGKMENISLNVFDATGKTVLRQQAMLQKGSNKVVVNGANLHSGIYSIQLISSGQSKTYRVVKL